MQFVFQHLRAFFGQGDGIHGVFSGVKKEQRLRVPQPLLSSWQL
jgi:hypothetical protein